LHPFCWWVQKAEPNGFFQTKMNGHESIESAQVQNQSRQNVSNLPAYYTLNGMWLDISVKRINVSDKNWNAGKGKQGGGCKIEQ